MFKIKSVVLCDDVRIENNGKYLLLGVYTGGVVFGAPEPLILPSFRAFITAFTDLQVIEGEVRVRAESGDASLLTTNIRMERSGVNNSDVTRLDISIPIGPIQFTSIGKYLVEYNFGGKQWNLIDEFEVIVAVN